jgi:hypothetical protein
MTALDRFTECIQCTDMSFVVRKRTPEWTIE